MGRQIEIKTRVKFSLVKDNQRKLQKASRDELLRGNPVEPLSKDTSPPPFSPGFVHFIALRPCTECKIVIVENISSNGLFFCFFVRFSMWNVLAKKRNTKRSN